MSASRKSLAFLPFVVELPPATSRWHRPARLARPVGYALLLAAMITACVQLQVGAARNHAAGQRADQRYRDALARYRAEPTEAHRRAAMAAAEKIAGPDLKRHKGALLRWRKAVRQFWAGRNIYQAARGAGAGDPLTGELLRGRTVPPEPPPRLGEAPEKIVDTDVRMHPNMPFVVILLTPLAYLPAQLATAVFNVLKVAAVLAAILAAAAVANHGRHRMGEWVVALAVLLALPLIISDLQHGNTNIFVLVALAGHLWLYRRGRDVLAGVVLALAVCLKLTPLLFGLYWLYQRNWRLLGGLAAALAATVVLIPLAAVGPERYDVLMGSWLHNLIGPGLLKGAPYPTHVNQSLSGVFSRLLMRGNIYYGPDDRAVVDEFAYVNFASLSPATGRIILLAIKLGILGVLAWAIGWRKLPRDDGRRSLHYGLVAAGMLILNQRTWDHHAVILLIAYLPLWYAIVYGRFGRRGRIACLAAVAAAGVLVWGMSGSLYPEKVADRLEAYGPTFLHFVIVFVLCAALLRTLGKAGREPPGPYALQRQRL